MRLPANLRNRNFWVMLGADMVVFGLSVFLAFGLRFDFSVPALYAPRMTLMMGYAIPLKALLFFVFGMYRGMWRYTSLDDFWRLIKVTLLQSGCMVGIAALGYHFAGFPRSVFLLDWGMTLVLTSGLRLGIRAVYVKGEALRLPRSIPRRLLLAGAGDAGERIVREIHADPSLGVVVGFVDDNPAKLNRTIHGRPVLGNIDAIPALSRKHDIDEVFITMVNNVSGERMRQIVAICKQSGLPHKVLPPMSEIVDGRISVGSLREVDYLDLLGRREVHLETDRIEAYIRRRVVLVTGCGGSIGSELCRQIVRFRPAFLVLVDVCECNLHGIEMELRHEYGVDQLVTVLGSVTDAPLMNRVFAEHKPEVVFHAAACKHVPLLERCPWQAVRNNIIGSQVVMEAALAGGVGRFVLVSTDKAVHPANVMGASKRVTELLMRRYENRGTRFMAVRFGNVLGSSGSVVPLFVRQIEQGGPVTVTAPDVSRYFMSISEAVQLILQAGSMEEYERGGDIFVLEMGRPVRIVDMARDLIRLSGKASEGDIEIVYTGLREGEKRSELLIGEGERVTHTEHSKILVVDWQSNAAPHDLDEGILRLAHAAEHCDAESIRAVLGELVPEYHPE